MPAGQLVLKFKFRVAGTSPSPKPLAPIKVDANLLGGRDSNPTSIIQFITIHRLASPIIHHA